MSSQHVSRFANGMANALAKKGVDRLFTLVLLLCSFVGMWYFAPIHVLFCCVA